MTKEKDEDGGFLWHSVSHSQSVLRIFPEIEALGEKYADELFPGRYWKLGEAPPIQTDLDKEISKLKLRKNGPVILPQDTLKNRGIVCPYYAVRMHTLRAAMHGRNGYESLNQDRIDKLNREKARWIARVEATEELLLYHKAEDVMQFGSLNLNIEDFNECNWLSIQDSRVAIFENLKLEVKRDRDQISNIENTLAHIKRMRGGSTAHLWLTPFYIYMANLWTMLTDEAIPKEQSSGGAAPFYLLLRAATKVIGGGDHYRYRWGQAKTLLPRYKDSLPGAGFIMHEDGSFSLDSEEAIAFRGDEMRDIIEGARRITPYSLIYIGLLRGMIALIDYNGECLEVIMKELVLRPIAERLDACPPRLRVQLGWVVEPNDDELVRFVRQAALSAIQGDRAASAVLSAASAIDGTVDDFLRKAGLHEGAYKYSFEDLCHDYEERKRYFPANGLPDLSDDKSFAVAMNIIQIIQVDFCYL